MVLRHYSEEPQNQQRAADSPEWLQPAAGQYMGPRDEPGGQQQAMQSATQAPEKLLQAWQPTEPQIGLNLLDSTHRDFPTIFPPS